MIWVGSRVPEWVLRRWDLWRRWCLDRDIALSLWDDERAASMPWTHFLGRMPHPVVQADFLRLEVVSKLGGVYVDSDTVPLPGAQMDDLFGERPGWSVLLNNPINPGEVNNGVFGFPAWHPFLHRVWEASAERLPRRYKRYSSIAGPAVWSKVASEYDDEAHPFEALDYERFYAEDMDLTRHTLEELTRMHPDRLMIHEFEQSWQHGYDGHGLHKPMPRWERRITGRSGDAAQASNEG